MNLKPVVDRTGQTRSYRYQHIYHELFFGELEPFELIYNSDTIVNNNKSEEIKELQDRLFKRIEIISKEHLTDNQYKVFVLRFIKGMGQLEIAEETGSRQSDVQKCINGVDKMNKSGTKNRIGGFIRKLQLVIEKDEVIKNILNEIEKISI